MPPEAMRAGAPHSAEALDAGKAQVTPVAAAAPAQARGEGIVPVSSQVAQGPAVYGRETAAAGINDPNQQYSMRYKVMSLDDLTASHLDSLEPNPLFPAELQPRLRDLVGSQEQIGKIARTLNPDALLEDTRSLDRGPMIVGRDNAVESGNGRTLALRKAKAENPLNWLAYQEGLREIAPSYGISVAELEGIPNPVLVRERIGPVDRVAFSAEANASNVLAMSPYETALQDAKRLTDSMVAGLDVGAEQSVEQALRSAGNRPLVKAFMETLAANERAALLDASGALNPAGLQRLKAAVFAKTYGGEAGRRLTQTFTESLDPGIKQIEAGMFGSLPSMGRAESLIRLGERDAGLSLADDMAAAVDMLARLKQEGMRIEDFLAQGALFERELTPFQEELLGWLNANNRSPKRIRELLAEYADGVIEAPTTSQMGLFGDVDRPTKEGIYERVRQATATADARADAGTLFAGAPQSATFGTAGPRLEGTGAKGAGAGERGSRGAAGASARVEAGAATYGQDARADFAKYKQLRSEFMAEADSQRIDELKAEMTRLAQAWQRNDPFSDYFTEFLENKALRPGDSPSGMNFTYGKSTFKKREGQWIYSKGVHEGQPVTNREIISNLERGLSDYRKEIDAAKAGASAPAPAPAPKGAPAGGKPIKAKDIPFGAPEVGGDRLAKLKQMAIESEERTGSQFWIRVPFTENPYYDPASRRLRMAIDSKGIVADLEAAGYHNIGEWWDAEIAPVKFPKYVSKYVLDAEGLTDVVPNKIKPLMGLADEGDRLAQAAARNLVVDPTPEQATEVLTKAFPQGAIRQNGPYAYAVDLPTDAA